MYAMLTHHIVEFYKLETSNFQVLAVMSQNRHNSAANGRIRFRFGTQVVLDLANDAS